MAHDFEDIDDIDDLSDDELRRLVRDRLTEHRALDVRDISIVVRDGVVALNGRVGTEGERRVAEHVLTDVVGRSRTDGFDVHTSGIGSCAPVYSVKSAVTPHGRGA